MTGGEGLETTPEGVVRGAGEPTVCRACDGDGWYVGHDDECFESGDCNCSGVQIGCDRCDGSGIEPVPCSVCHGLGEWMHWVEGAFHHCAACAGSGWASCATGDSVASQKDPS